MFPVLAEQEIRVITQRNQQSLDAAERGRVFRSLGTASEAPHRERRSLTRAWTRLNGTIDTFFRVFRGGHRPIETGGRAAARS